MQDQLLFLRNLLVHTDDRDTIRIEIYEARWKPTWRITVGNYVDVLSELHLALIFINGVAQGQKWTNYQHFDQNSIIPLHSSFFVICTT